MLNIVLVGTPSYGFTQLYNKQIRYTPYGHYAGPDQFTYTIKNSKYEASTYVNITVVDYAPEPNPDTM